MENDILKAAIGYCEKGFSIIPIRKDKKPFFSWTRYQSEKASIETICQWWDRYPQANIGIVTGKISGLSVVDIDSRQGEDKLIEIVGDVSRLNGPIAHTPHGKHLYFSDCGRGNAVGLLDGVDFRGEGGYIVAPPSLGEEGTYAWAPGCSIFEKPLPAVPESVFTLINANTPFRGEGGRNAPANAEALQSVTRQALIFAKGHRDQTIFHIANCLLKGQMPAVEVEQLLALIASRLCTPAFPQRDVQAKIQSALKRVERQKRNLSKEILDWISVTDGFFDVTRCDNELHIVTKAEKTNRRVIFHRLVNEKKLLEKHPSRAGVFRKRETELEAIDFLGTKVKNLDITLPFGLSNLVEIMPGNIILVSGEPNSGKTALLLNVVRQNMRNFEVNFFSSEMGPAEMKKRLLKFDGLELKDWAFKAWERSSNFADVIRPGEGKLNIIDYLEIHDNFYEVGGHLAKIHDSLHGALAIVALQKNKDTDTGLGGGRTLEKPRLALAMRPGALKIVKAKNWRGSKNPNGKEITFKIVDGCRFITTSGWEKK